MNRQKPSPFFLIEVFCIFILFATLYLLTLGKNFSGAHNAIFCVQEIGKGALFAASHPFYNWLAAQWLWFWRLFGLVTDSTLWIESLNAVVSALALAAFFAILRKRFGLIFFPALCATALPAFSYGLWFFGTTVGAVTIALFFLILLFYLLTAPRLDSWSCCWIGIVHGLAVLSYQFNGLFLPVALDVLLLQKNRLNISHLRALCLYLVTLGLVIAVPYSAVMLLKHSFQSWHQALIWLLNFTANNSSGQWLRGFSLAGIVETAIGVSRTIIGGHFLLNLPPVKHFLELKLAGKSLIGSAFIVRNLPVNVGYFLIVLTTIVCITILIACSLAVARRRGSLWQNSPFWRSALIWLSLYSTFAIIWDPSEVELWIIQSMVFWLLLVILWCGGNQLPPRHQLAPTLAFFVIAAGLATINYSGSIYWLSKPENDYYRVKISPIIKEAAPGDLTIVLDSSIIDHYLEHYSAADIIALTVFYEKNGDNTLEKLLTIIRQRLTAGKQVFIMSDVLQSESLSHEIGLISFIEEADRNLHERYAQAWRPLPTEAGIVYMLTGQNRATNAASSQ